MGRTVKDSDGIKSEKINIRVGADLRRRILAFIKDGPCEGEELQVVIRMLIRAGLAVEERFKEVRDEVEREIEERGATMRKEKSDPPASRKQGN